MMKRRQVVLVALSIMACASGCRTPGVADSSGTAAIEQGVPAEIELMHRLDLKEASGLVTLPESDGEAATLHAIGDYTSQLVRLSFADWRAEPDVIKHDLKKIFGSGPLGWEGVAADGMGHVVILRENPSRLYVLERSGRSLMRQIHLDTSALTIGEGGDNSLGEGLALLNDGHLIFLKEKAPPLLIEFGPGGDRASGVSPSTLLGVGQEWPSAIGEDVVFVPLKIWAFGEETQALMQDFSDLAIGEDATLYVLSDESRRIARLERNIMPDESKAKIKAYWNLPHAIDKPEGLAFIGQHPVIANDQIGGKNLFVLKKLSQ